MPKINIEGADLPTKTVEVPTTGALPSGLVAEISAIEVVDKPLAADYQAALAFMEEKIEVMVHETTDPNAENPVQVAVNGINQFFMRGQPQTVRRKYVEVLARAKRGNITTPEVTQGGERTATIRKTQALAYPFSIIRDDNPKGPAWLKQIMQEA